MITSPTLHNGLVARKHMRDYHDFVYLRFGLYFLFNALHGVTGEDASLGREARNPGEIAKYSRTWICAVYVFNLILTW